MDLSSINTSETFLAWLAEKKSNGVGLKSLFALIGLPSLYNLLGPQGDEAIWTYLQSVGEQEEDPIQFLQSLYRQSRLPIIRGRGPRFQTHEQAVDAIKRASKILVLTGAGISVSSGVPDFRSPGGLYEQIARQYKLPEPTLLFEINYFKKNPQPFFSFAKQLYPTKEIYPSPAHMFIRLLETQGKLLRNFTQNVDTLEKLAGIENYLCCHGSFATASCVSCLTPSNPDLLKEIILKGEIPYCPVCADGKAVIKPDVVFFGESLPSNFHDKLMDDCRNCDLLIVMGSSLKVAPVNLIPELIATYQPHVPQILINYERVLPHHVWDFFYEGPCDESVKKIVASMGLELPPPPSLPPSGLEIGRL